MNIYAIMFCLVFVAAFYYNYKYRKDAETYEEDQVYGFALALFWPVAIPLVIVFFISLGLLKVLKHGVKFLTETLDRFNKH